MILKILPKLIKRYGLKKGISKAEKLGYPRSQINGALNKLHRDELKMQRRIMEEMDADLIKQTGFNPYEETFGENLGLINEALKRGKV